MKAAIRALSACLALATCVGCAEGSGGPTRVVNGEPYEGRFILPEAYAAYFMGSEREARGDYRGALLAYRTAHAEDPESPEVWARIGAIECQLSPAARGPSASAQAFARGLRLDSSYFSLYFERARCAERAGSFSAALPDATAAVAYRPIDEPANLLVARLLEALGRKPEARRWLEAFQSFALTSSAVTEALNRAPTMAKRTGVTRSGAFAFLLEGEFGSALQRADAELDADPTNSDAWVASLLASDALRDEAHFDTTLDRLRIPALPLSEPASEALAALLTRRAGVALPKQKP